MVVKSEQNSTSFTARAGYPKSMAVFKMKKCPTCIGIGSCTEGDKCPTCEGTGEVASDEVIIDEPCQPLKHSEKVA